MCVEKLKLLPTTVAKTQNLHYYILKTKNNSCLSLWNGIENANFIVD